MKKDLKVKTVQFAVGVELMASKMSVSAVRGTELELTPYGVFCESKSSGRSVLIPFPNIKGIEFFPEVEEKKSVK